MNIGIRGLLEAADIVGQAGEAEAAIIAQFMVDLALTAQFSGDGEVIAPREAGRLLRLRLARHRALTYQTSHSIH
jgi:hypothetical protein